MDDVRRIHVEVAYALPDKQVIIPVEIPEGATIEEAIRASNLVERFPEIDLGVAKVGVFSRLARLSTVLKAGDRVEIYRPLIADPKAVRQERAAAGKRMSKGGGDA